jgi:hypothetical protein
MTLDELEALRVDFGVDAKYRAYCRTCNLAIDMTTRLSLVSRYKVDAEPGPELRGLAYELWRAFDVGTYGPEKRDHNREVDRFEERIRGSAFASLARAGCSHANRRLCRCLPRFAP